MERDSWRTAAFMRLLSVSGIEAPIRRVRARTPVRKRHNIFRCKLLARFSVCKVIND